ncbi:MAG: hypothetical protein K0S80_2615 [Neobacillus sp.]|nr:hypothetical protein [Neobacillus sp.]
MQINFQMLRSILKESGLPVYRDEAPTTAMPPFIEYEYVNELHKRASSKVLKSMPLYQIAVVTKGTEVDFDPLKDVLNKYDVEYSQFTSIPYDENDATVTQFITNVRCVN